MPLNYQDAYDHYTDPSKSDSERDASAKALVAGVASAEVYLNHTDPLTAIRAYSEGAHLPGQIEATQPQSDATATAVEEPVSGTVQVPAGSSADPATRPALEPAPVNPEGAIATLRKQLQDAGLSPEA